MTVMPLDTKLTKIGLPPSIYVPLGLARGLQSFPRPETLADVLRIARAGRLGEINGIGDTRIAQIEARLATVGHPLSGPSR
jgi:hypothetical protein